MPNTPYHYEQVIQTTQLDQIDQLEPDFFRQFPADKTALLSIDWMQRMTAEHFAIMPLNTRQNFTPIQVAAISFPTWQALQKETINTLIRADHADAWVDYLKALPAKYLNEIEGLFTRLQPAHIQQILTPARTAEVHPQKLIQIPAECWTAFLPADIRAMPATVMALAGADQLNRLSPDCVGAMLPEQIEQVASRLAQLERPFLFALNPLQVQWLGNKVADIQPSLFAQEGVHKFLAAFYQGQMGYLTIEQLGRLSPASIQQFVEHIQQQTEGPAREEAFAQRIWGAERREYVAERILARLESFIGGMHHAQLRHLSLAQIDAFALRDGPGVTDNVMRERLDYLFLSSRTRYEIAGEAPGVVLGISPRLLRKLGVDFLNKLTVAQFDLLSPEQSQVFSDEALQAARSRQPGSLRYIVLQGRQQSFLGLSPEDIPKLDSIVTNLTMDELAVMTGDQLGAMTPKQIHDQSVSFFAHLGRLRRLQELSLEQRQSIDCSRLRIDNFWSSFSPLAENDVLFYALWVNRQLMVTSNQQQLRVLAQGLSPDQVATLAPAVYSYLGDHLLRHFNEAAIRRVPPAFLFNASRDLVLHLNRFAPNFYYDPARHAMLVSLQADAIPALLWERLSFNHYESLRALHPNLAQQIPIHGISHIPLAVFEQNIIDPQTLNAQQFKQLPVALFANGTIDLSLSPDVLKQAATPQQINAWGIRVDSDMTWMDRAFIQSLPLEAMSLVFISKLSNPQFEYLRKEDFANVSVRTMRELIATLPGDHRVGRMINKKIVTREMVDSARMTAERVRETPPATFGRMGMSGHLYLRPEAWQAMTRAQLQALMQGYQVNFVNNFDEEVFERLPPAHFADIVAHRTRNVFIPQRLLSVVSAAQLNAAGAYAQIDRFNMREQQLSAEVVEKLELPFLNKLVSLDVLSAGINRISKTTGLGVLAHKAASGWGKPNNPAGYLTDRDSKLIVDAGVVGVEEARLVWMDLQTFRQQSPEAVRLIPPVVLPYLHRDIWVHMTPEHFTELMTQHVDLAIRLPSQLVAALPLKHYIQLLSRHTQSAPPPLDVLHHSPSWKVATWLNTWAVQPGREGIHLPNEYVRMLSDTVMERLSAQCFFRLSVEQFMAFSPEQYRRVGWRTWQAMVRYAPMGQGEVRANHLRQLDIVSEQDLAEWVRMAQSEAVAAEGDAPPSKRLKKTHERVILTVVTQWAHSGQPGDLVDQARENYQQKRAERDLPEAYRLVLAPPQQPGPGVQLQAKLGRYDFLRRIYVPVPSGTLPPEIVDINKLLIIGHTVKGQIAGVNADVLASNVRGICQHVGRIGQINLEACTVDTHFLWRFLHRFTTQAHGQAGEQIDPRFPTLAVVGSRFSLFFAGPGHNVNPLLVRQGQHLSPIGEGQLRHGVPESRIRLSRDPLVPTLQHIQYIASRGGGETVPFMPGDAGPLNMDVFEASRVLQSETQERQALKRQLTDPRLPEIDSKTMSTVYNDAQALRAEQREVQWIRNLESDYLTVQKEMLNKVGETPDSDWFLLPPPFRRRPDGDIEVVLLNQKSADQATPEQRTIVTTASDEQTRLAQFSQNYQEAMSALQPAIAHLRVDSQGDIHAKPGAPVSARALSNTRGGKLLMGASSGIFGVRAWASYFMKKNTPLGMQIGTYQKIQQISADWNLADATIGVADDAVRFAKFALVRFTRSGATATQGGVLMLRQAGLVLRRVNIVFTIGSLGFDIYQIAAAKDEEARIQAGISIATTLVSLGVAIVLGPLVALPIALLGLLISYIVEDLWSRHRETSHTLDELLILDRLLAKGGFEVREQSLWFGDAAIRKVDFPNGKVILDSHQIRAYHEMDVDWARTPYKDLREGLGYTGQRQQLTDLAFVPRVRLLPADPKKYGLDYVIRSCHYSFTASEEQKRVWQRLGDRGAIRRPTTGGGAGNQIDCPPSYAEKHVLEDIPFEVVLDTDTATYGIPAQAGKNKPRYVFQTHEQGSNAFITGFHLGVILTLRDPAKVVKRSLLQVNVSTPVENVMRSVSVSLRDGKRQVVVRYDGKQSSEMDVTGLNHAMLQVTVQETSEENMIITGKAVTFAIQPSASEPVINEIHFIGHGPEQAQQQLAGITLSHKTKISFEPPQPKLPDVMVRRSWQPLHGYIPRRYHFTKITVTATTKRTEQYQTYENSETALDVLPNIDRIATEPTPRDDPFFKEQERHLKALSENRQRSATTFWDADSKTILWFSELSQGFVRPVDSLDGNDAFFFQSESGKLFQVAWHDTARPKTTALLPFVNSFVSHLACYDHALTFSQTLLYENRGSQQIVIDYHAAAGIAEIKALRGLDASQFAAFALTTQAWAQLLDIEDLNRKTGLFNGLTFLKVSVTDSRDNLSKSYAVIQTGAKVPLLEGEEIVGLHTNNTVLLLHSPEKKTARVIRLLDQGNYIVKETIEDIAKIVLSDPARIFMISEGGKEIVSLNPESATMKRVSTPAGDDGLSRRVKDHPIGIKEKIQPAGGVIESSYEEEGKTFIVFMVPYGKRGTNARMICQYDDEHQRLRLTAIEGLMPAIVTNLITRTVGDGRGDFLSRLWTLLALQPSLVDEVAAWIKLSATDGRAHFLHPRSDKSLPVEPDARLFKLGLAVSGREQYLLWLPTAQRVQVVAIQEHTNGRPPSDDNRTMLTTSDVRLEAQPFTGQIDFVAESDGEVLLAVADGRQVYRANAQGELMLQAKVAVVDTP